MRVHLLIAVLLAGCASVGSYVWVEDYQPADPPAAYVLGPGDLLDVRVFHEDGMSGKLRVRADGMISVPFIGDVRASGQTPPQLAGDIETRLRQFIKTPVVTVALEEPRAAQVPVLGEVAHPGLYPLADAGLVQALASAGGLTQFASRDKIFVLRPGIPAARIRFRFADIAHAEGRAATFRLQAGDSVVVE